MLLQEFIHLTGVNVTSLEYQAIETEYLNTDIDKNEISLFWCVRKNGTGLYENKKDAETWANDWHDQIIAQYKVVLLNKLATIERIN